MCVDIAVDVYVKCRWDEDKDKDKDDECGFEGRCSLVGITFVGKSKSKGRRKNSENKESRNDTSIRIDWNGME